jgi:hypothetical protein
MSASAHEEPRHEATVDKIRHDKELGQTTGREDQKTVSRPEYDDPFGDEEDVEVKYRTMTWW